MRKLNLLVCLTVILPNLTLSQVSEKIYEFPRYRIGVEAGFESYFGSNKKPSAIRESQSYYRYEYDDYYYGGGYLYNEPVFTKYYFGVKPEFSLNLNFAVSAGFRFGFGESSLKSDRDFFLWRIEESNSHTNYVRVKDIRQKVYNFSFPVELTLYPNKSDIIVRFYGKLSAVLNIAFADDVSVKLVNSEMNKYLPEIENYFEKPDLFYWQFVPAIGIKVGRMKKPFGRIEFQLPILVSDKKQLNSLFKNNDIFGFNLQAIIFIPFGTEKLSYNYR